MSNVIQKLNGADISEFQPKVDWTQVKSQKLDFIFLRASHGSVADIMFASHRAGAASIDLQAGHYHFFNPTISVAVQVKVFVQAVGQLANTDLPPVIDLETPSLYAKIPLAKRLPLIMSFVLAVEKAFGVKPLIYCNRTFVSGTLAGPGIDTSVLGAYMLYLAEYGVPAGKDPTLPTTWTRWAFYQYTNTGTLAGITGNVDRDYFQGTTADLLQLRSQLKSSTATMRTGLAEFAMARELSKMAQVGMSANYSQMFEWREPARRARLQDRTVIAQSMPDEQSVSVDVPVSAIFAGLDIADVLSMCFSEKAVQLILEHSYNDYLLWKHVACGLQNLKCGPRKLPIGASHQRRQMFDNTPFGVIGSADFVSGMERLRKAVAGDKARFNPELALRGAYAYELVQSGFVLLKTPASESAEPESPQLVISPMWSHLLKKLKA